MTQLSLPGLDGPEDTRDGPMAKSARMSLQALQADGRLEARHAVLVQLVQSLAAAIDRGVTSGRASAVAMAAKQLLETMLVLDPPADEAPASAEALRVLQDFHARLEEYANQGDRP